MSPRAACRLETFGHTQVYDYVVGKADWLAAGHPTERGHPVRARVTEAMDRAVPTCTPGERIADVVARLAPSGPPVCVVVNDRHVVQGRLRRHRLDAADNDRLVEAVMEPGPATVRADADLAATIDRMKAKNVESLIVSTPDGTLLGVLLNDQPGSGHR